MRYLSAIGAAIVFALVCSPASAAKKPKPPMTAEYVRSLVAMKDDSLETTASFDTVAVTQKKYGWSAPQAVAFLRAMVDKTSGKTVFQVYSVINYSIDWRFYERANYETAAGPQQVDLIKISRDVTSCRYGCSYSEHVAFELPEAQVRENAALPADAKWKFRLKSKAGVDSDVEIEPAEFGGLLGAVDEYRAAHAPKN